MNDRKGWLEAHSASELQAVILLFPNDRFHFDGGIRESPPARRRNGTTPASDLGFIDRQKAEWPTRGVRTGNGIAALLTSKHAGKLAATVPHRMVTH